MTDGNIKLLCIFDNTNALQSFDTYGSIILCTFDHTGVLQSYEEKQCSNISSLTPFSSLLRSEYLCPSSNDTSEF